jgi:hypothetical protein
MMTTRVVAHRALRKEKLHRHRRRAVRDSIRRMIAAHAAAMNGVDGWRFESSLIDDGAALTVIPPAKDLAKLRGLGFIGVMARGMDHPPHHLMIARGENPHE